MSNNTKMVLSEFAASFLLGFFGLGLVVQFAILGTIHSLFEFGAAFGLIIAFVVIIFNPISGAQFNPGVTLALCVFKGFDKKLLLPFWIVQTLGWGAGVMGVYALYWGTFADWMAETGGNAATLFYCNMPVNHVISGSFVELFATAMLVLAIFAMIDPRIPNRPSDAGFPFAVAAIILFLVCFCAGFTGTSLNFARDLGPRLAGLIYGLINGLDVSMIFGNMQWLAYIISTLVGAVVGGLFFEKIVVKLFLKHDAEAAKE